MILWVRETEGRWKYGLSTRDKMILTEFGGALVHHGIHFGNHWSIQIISEKFGKDF